MNNINNSGGTDFSKITRVDASDADVLKYSLKYGDFLFNTRNSFELVGKSCYYNSIDGHVMLFNNNIMRITFVHDINTIFITYLFQDTYIKEQLDQIKKGTTSVWAIYYKDLQNISIVTPPLPLQHQFASKIEAIERQKELIKQSISETETLFNERMQHYFG
jgi:type I restriction enzyme S subunit